jgi:hypothetical protein
MPTSQSVWKSSLLSNKFACRFQLPDKKSDERKKQWKVWLPETYTKINYLDLITTFGL